MASKMTREPPVIMITPIDARSPYRFEDTTYYPKFALWNHNILATLWVGQTVTLAMRLYMCVQVLMLSFAAGHPLFAV